MKHIDDIGIEDEGLAADACPIFLPDPSVVTIQMVMAYNGYWGKPDGQKTSVFFSKLNEFVKDLEKGKV